MRNYINKKELNNMWSYKIIEIKNGYHKVIFDNESGTVFFVVDNLDEEFVTSIIDAHNNSLNQAFRNGIQEGRNIMNDLHKGRL